jgi:hypothetical protein
MPITRASMCLDSPGVCDIQALIIRTEAQPVTFNKAICHHPALFTCRIEPIDLRGQYRGRPETLMIAIVWIGKPNFPCLMVDNDIVDGIELAAVEIVDECF